MDHLSEFEGLTDVKWADQVRRIEHHFSLLLPCLKQPARKAFRDALNRARAKQEGLMERDQLTRDAATLVTA